MAGISYVDLSAGENSYDYTYNALGQRVEKSFAYINTSRIQPLPPGGFGESQIAYTTGKNTKFYYDHSGRLIAEYCVENLSDFTETSYRLEYLYDESGMIGLSYTTNNVYRGTYYFQRNLQGDVVGIYDTNGTRVVEYRYDAFGNCSVASTTTNYEIALTNPIRYRGYYFDQETGWYFLNARYYSPEWRRFISPDDTEYLDPKNVNGLNLYCYCNNDPVNFVDPSGHEAKWWAWVFSGFLVTAGIIMSATGFGGIAGGILIGAGAGSLINGYVNEANGGSFLAGYIGGAISGALCGAGAGWAGILYMSATAGSGLAALGLMGASMVTSFSFGFMGNMFGTLVTALLDKQSVNAKTLIHSSITMGALNILAGFGSGISSEIANLGKIAIDSNSQWAHRLLAGTVAGATEAFYDTFSYLYGFWN